MNPEQNFQDPEVEQLVQKPSALNSVTPLSKYLAMILFIILPFVGGWIGYSFSPTKLIEVEKVVYSDIKTLESVVNTEIPLNVVNTETETCEEIIPQKASIVYKNTEYGFELNLPERWKDYQVIEDKRIIVFKLKQTNPYTLDDGTEIQYSHVFAIKVFTYSEWEKDQNHDFVGFTYNFLAKNDQYVFGIKKGHDDTGFAGFPPGPHRGGCAYDGPYYDFSNVIAPSFKLI